MKYCLYFNRFLIILIFAFGIGACGGGSGGGSDNSDTMVKITGGTFIMGSPASEPNRNSAETQHSVTVSDFYISKYQVTQKEWEEVMGSNPSYFQGANLPSGLANGDNLPVEQVTWYDAVAYCNELSDSEGFDKVYTITSPSTSGGHITSATVAMDLSKNGYRLPTEAEWEYACRGKYSNKATETATKPFGIGDGTKMVLGLANFYIQYSYDLAQSGHYDVGNNTGYKGATTPIGSYKANSYGLYDMHGNVFEWCWDWYDTYPGSGGSDYTGPGSGSGRVLRGGSWSRDGYYLRSAFRGSGLPSNWGDIIGFRVARSL